MSQFNAHSPDTIGKPPHDLRTHLEETACLARKHAIPFASGEWAKLAGMWHDLGKYNPEFQRKLIGEKVSVEHAGVGAVRAYECFKDLGLALSFVIAGHHAGLTNASDSAGTGTKSLKERLGDEDNKRLIENLRSLIPDDILMQPLPPLPEFLNAAPFGEEQRRRSEFWIRFLFSALVDADYLDTENYYQPGIRSSTSKHFSKLSDLLERLEKALDEKARIALPTTVNLLRLEILHVSRERSLDSPGFFSLTVPTGGGKTFSSMNFALRHAVSHGLRRVISVLPFTSIIEQNAEVYRNVLGRENVVEHHSNFDVKKSKRDFGLEITKAHERAAENWDAPFIVTTTVQFFESLFANKTSRCRKLHNIAKSVVILDEVQSLPPEFLSTILDGLKELVSHYGCTVLLSTATPPALEHRERFSHGLTNVRKIIRDPVTLATKLIRVESDWSRLENGPLSWEQVAGEMSRENQVLAIVHFREDARILSKLLPEEGRFQLSALMCPAHRSYRLEQIKSALKAGAPCRVAATSLVEAGVDFSFPVVYRALTGLDSLAQAAGRCNREGELSAQGKLGRLVVFASERKPKGVPLLGMETTASMLNENGGHLDLNDPGIFETYFRRLYHKTVSDPQGIQTDRAKFNFATVAEKFKLIDDYSMSIVVPYEGSSPLLEKLRSAGPNRELMRELQRYTVQIPPHAFQILKKAGGVQEVRMDSEVYSLTVTHEHYYTPEYGLVVEDGRTFADPSVLVQ